MIESKYLEALFFAAVHPLSLEECMQVFDSSLEDTVESLHRFERELEEQQRGLRLRRTGDSFELVTAQDCSSVVTKIRQREEKLSAPALETLAVIAFKQPITRAEVEEIRGVNCERMIKLLLEKELILDMGRKPVLGRPLLYGTTEQFLRAVGMESMDALKEKSKEEALKETASQNINIEDESM